MQLIDKATSKGIIYHVFRDEEGLLFVKFDNGHLSAATGRPILKQLGKGSIKDDGTFTGILTMKDKHGHYLDPHVRGSYVLRLLIDTEINSGKNFERFKSTWVAGSGISDNLNTFNKGLAQELSEPEAARQTWTGQWLKKNYDFEQVHHVKGQYTLAPNINGTPCRHYTEVTVVFSP
ncbi:hypothetical protein [Microscilla marina]|uniref:Uncharacterized protein n=1 Tax=Microscilla marina ATCC 23134 TaxID=313606 RepID=A1ZRD1_MICM2|nr:hypothetical protein [Microscilla marina]EAY27021.1 hypothetical protein M23134_04709 [Microscilla marina ATCC 23134]